MNRETRRMRHPSLWFGSVSMLGPRRHRFPRLRAWGVALLRSLQFVFEPLGPWVAYVLFVAAVGLIGLGLALAIGGLFL